VNRDSLTARLDRFARGLDCNLPQLRQILLLENWMRHRFDADCVNVVSVAS
jgi:hypothetical protein